MENKNQKTVEPNAKKMATIKLTESETYVIIHALANAHFKYENDGHQCLADEAWELRKKIKSLRGEQIPQKEEEE